MCKKPRWPDGQGIDIVLDPRLPMGLVMLESPEQARFRKHELEVRRRMYSAMGLPSELLEGKGGTR